MTQIRTNSTGDVPVPVAIALLVAVYAFVEFGVKQGLHPSLSLSAINTWIEINDKALLLAVLGAFINIVGIGIVITPFVSAKRQGSHLRALTKKFAKKLCSVPVKPFFGALGVATLVYIIDWLAKGASVVWISALPGGGVTAIFRQMLSLNAAGALFTVTFWLLKFTSLAKRHRQLPPPPRLENSIVLGADESDPTNPKWVTAERKALNGNVLITGSIGSGKTQGAILPYFDQILSTFKPTPSVLAIDPKGSFVREAMKIANRHGLTDKCLHMRLGGDVRYNPIYLPDALKGSRCIEIAQMLRAATINSLGRSADNSFWEISSFNLIKNGLVYCAAIYGYYTLWDLYTVLVRAATGNLAKDLEEHLGAQEQLGNEERFNIAQAVTYFGGEFAQFEDRVRSGIVASATAFLNQFQDFQVAQVFCPEQSAITLTSVDQAIDDGKIILFDIENPALAKAMGTILKLQYQQSLLNRLGEAGRTKARCGLLVIDEYQDVVTSGHGVALGDERFLAKGREANTITIAATQSLTSLENALGREKAARELFQNFRTRIAGSSGDIYTIRSFQELAGEKETERMSHSVSETSQDARPNLFLGGYESARTNLSESVTTSSHKEYRITAEEFVRLGAFECFAQIFDGSTTEFRRLCLKPYFLGRRPISHRNLVANLKKLAAGALAFAILNGSTFAQGASAPNLCSVVKSPQFDQCAGVQVSSCTCPGLPTRPCAQISYYRPETFIEVVPNSGQTAFGALPLIRSQLASVATHTAVPFGAEGELDSHAFQAHVLDVPLASLIGNFLPCGSLGVRDRGCFDAMSEHLGDLWTTGRADLTQLGFLAWAANPKACLVAGAVQSVVGGGANLAFSPGSHLCSVRRDWESIFPPSTHNGCIGWGPFFPRTGTYVGASQTVAALMVAARMKSLASEVFQSTPSSPDEKWQMTLPGTSACFREGQNPAWLETGGQVTEVRRLAGGPANGFLFTVWRRVSCCRDWPEAAALQAQIVGMKAACASEVTP